MSAHLSDRPGLARALPPLSTTHANGPELKAEAIRLLPLTGLSMRDCWRTYEGGTWSWSTIQRYFDAGYPKVCPKPRFVQWLKLKADMRALDSAAREFEAAQ